MIGRALSAELFSDFSNEGIHTAEAVNAEAALRNLRLFIPLVF
jgi:L-amino acid N-acyltransferase YncA